MQEALVLLRGSCWDLMLRKEELASGAEGIMLPSDAQHSFGIITGMPMLPNEHFASGADGGVKR